MLVTFYCIFFFGGRARIGGRVCPLPPPPPLWLRHLRSWVPSSQSWWYAYIIGALLFCPDFFVQIRQNEVAGDRAGDNQYLQKRFTQNMLIWVTYPLNIARIINFHFQIALKISQIPDMIQRFQLCYAKYKYRSQQSRVIYAKWSTQNRVLADFSPK